MLNYSKVFCILKVLKRSVEIVVSSILFYSGLLFLYTRTIGKKRILILFYHEVGNDKDILGNIAVKPEIFEMQMKYISMWYNAISIDDLSDYIEGKTDLPPNPIAITFDGGYIGNYKNAYPVLKKYNLPATIYPVTESIEKRELPWTMRLNYIIKATKEDFLKMSFLDEEKMFSLKTMSEKLFTIKEIKKFLYNVVPEEKDKIIESIVNELKVNINEIPTNLLLSWDEIKKMNEEGLVSFGSHTLTHPMLLKMPTEVVIREVSKSKIDIESKVGQEITSFCYPDGYFSEDIKNIVRDAGYHTAISTIYPLCQYS